MSDIYQYLFCDYFATGEGRTLCVMITRAYPTGDDYSSGPYFDEDGFHLGELKNTAQERAAREFKKEFGYFSIGMENLSKEEFITRCGRLLPEMVLKLVNSEDPPGNLYFAQEFHFNYS